MAFRCQPFLDFVVLVVFILAVVQLAHAGGTYDLRPVHSAGAAFFKDADGNEKLRQLPLLPFSQKEVYDGGAFTLLPAVDSNCTTACGHGGIFSDPWY